MSGSELLEWVSNGTQVALGAVALLSAWALRHVPTKRWALTIIGVSMVVSGVAGLMSIGELPSINFYRRPLFILERAAMIVLIVSMVIRAKATSYQRSHEDA